MEDLKGRVIKGYELKRLAGEGGFGAVYLATQRLIGREVAVKIILPQYANQPDFIRRFETEAQLVARLEHPHIVPLYDYWREPSGAYLVMRWLRGGSLSDSLRKEGAWNTERVSVMLTQIAAALAVAHRQGVVHRDLKPENILMDENGNAYLSDFGIAKDLGGKESITQNNALIGSPAYISPEQIRGQTVTPQSDIYMLGLLVYEMLTGEHPFKDNTAASLLYKHLSEPLPSLHDVRPELPIALNMVLQKATSKEPTERYHDVLEMASDFRRALRPNAITESDTMYITSTSLGMPEPENPYKGLRAFQQADALDFFGRETLVRRLMDRLEENAAYNRFLAVIGPSGSGKSSVVKAGLIPALKRGDIKGSEHWFVVEMVPGIDPMEELEAALLRIAVNPPDSLLRQLNEDERGFVRAVKRVLPGDSEDAELLLFIDQFEELFTLVDDEGIRTHFMNSLIAAVTDPRSRIRVMITLRADFYDKPLNYVKFGELMQKRTEIVLPLSADEIERAVNGPADRAGLILERGLTTSIVADVNEQPGALPLLQYALTELYERREGRTLSLRAYHEMGGTLGALAQRADELYDGLGDEGQEAARQMFLRLVTLGEGTEDTRRRVMQDELMSIGNRDEMSMVLDAFGRYRLITFDRDPSNRASTVEVAHEALIRQWGRLRAWLNESREDLRLQRRIANAADEWRAANRESSFLVRGGRLEQFEEWANNTNLTLNDIEREFLQASITERENRLAEEKRRQEREDALERRSRNRLRMLVGVFAGATVIAALLTVFAFSQSEEAQRAQRIAERNASEARALALAANARSAINEDNPQLALSLAEQAVNEFEPAPVEVLRVLSNAAYGPNFTHQLTGNDGSVTGTAFDPTSNRAVTVSARGELTLWDTETGEELQRYSGTAEYYTSVAFSPDGTLIAVGEAQALEEGANAGAVSLIDANSGEIVQRFISEEGGHTDIVTSVSFSGDGSKLLSSALDRTMILWDVTSGEMLQRFEPGDDDTNFTGAIAASDISPDGAYAVSGHVDETIGSTNADRTDRTVRIWDTASGHQLFRLDPKLGFVRTVDFSPDGTMVLAGSWSGAAGGVVVVWDVRTGTEIQRIFADVSVITSARFSPDGKSVLVGSWGRTVSLWSISTGANIERFEGLNDRVLAVDFSPDGQYAIVGTGNVGNNDIGVAFDTPADTSAWLIDLRDRSEIRTLRGHNDWVWEMDLNADGTRAVSGGGSFTQPVKDTRVLVWDVESGEVLHALGKTEGDTTIGHTNTVDGVAFTPDGQQVLSGGWDSQVLLWDIASESIVRAFEGHEGQVHAVDVSPDGQYGASVDKLGAIILWDLATGEEVRRFEGGHETVAPAVNHVAFSPDGSQLLTSGDDKKIILWNVADASIAQTFIGHKDRVNTVEFSPDGSRIASTSWDSSVRLWDVATGQQIREFVGHNSETFGIAFSPDGKSLLSGSSDATVRMWDVESGDELLRLTGHTSWIQSLKFHPSGDFAISGAQDNTLKVWRTAREPEKILQFARESRYMRDLSCAEYLRYRLNPPQSCTTESTAISSQS